MISLSPSSPSRTPQTFGAAANAPAAPRSRLARLHPYLIGGAWLFIFASLVQVVAAMCSSGSALGSMLIYSPAGLTYSGALGVMWGLLQVAIVGGAAVATLRASARWRRIGHGVLLAWALLWTLDLYGFAGVTAAVQEFARAAMMTAMLGCTGYRAVRGWAVHAAADQFDDGKDNDDVGSGEPSDWRDVFRRDARRGECERLTSRHVTANSDRVVDVTPLPRTLVALKRAREFAATAARNGAALAQQAARRAAPIARRGRDAAIRGGRCVAAKLRQWAVLPQQAHSRDSSVA